jgi:hypothetical protein
LLCGLVNATEKAAAQTAARLAENSRHKLRRLALQKQQEELGLQPLAELHEPTRDMLVRQEKGAPWECSGWDTGDATATSRHGDESMTLPLF